MHVIGVPDGFTQACQAMEAKVMVQGEAVRAMLVVSRREIEGFIPPLPRGWVAKPLLFSREPRA